MKAFVIRFSSLGDCVLLCPFLEHLKRHGVVEVAVVTKRAYVELFASVRGVDRIVALDPAAGWRCLRQIARSHRDDDYVVIDAHNNPRSRLVAMGLGGAEATIGKFYWERLALIWFKRRADIPTVSERYSELGESLGFPAMNVAAGGLDVPERCRARARERLRTVRSETIVMAPGSRWAMKIWGEDKFAELARRIVKRYGFHFVLLGDRKDHPAAARIAASLGAHATNLAGETSIMEAAAVMERATAFVGNDSGLMHLAEAVGVPAVALFGPTVEAFGYYPSLPASKVIERRIGCRPCSRNGSRPCPKGSQECLTGIGVEPVESAFAELLNNRGEARYVLN